MGILDIFKKKKEATIEEIAKRELEENIEVIKSLRDYDEGKKDIRTDHIERRFNDLHASS